MRTSRVLVCLLVVAWATVAQGQPALGTTPINGQLFLQYRFDEGPLGAAPTVLVEDILGNDGVSIGSPEYAPSDGLCPGDLALDFDPNDGDIDFVTNSSTITSLGTLTGDLSVEAKVYLRSPATGSQFIVSNWPFGSGFQFTLWALDGHFTVAFSDGVPGQFDQATDPSLLVPDAWHHLVGVRDQANDEVRLYVDGILVDTAPIQWGLALNSSAFAIGARGEAAGSLPVDGLISYVGLSSYAMTEDDIVNCHSTAVSLAGGLSPLQLRVHPNPMQGSTILSYRTGSLTAPRIDVFDIRGRRVTALPGPLLSDGVGTVQWSGRDDQGKAVAGGMYFVRLRSGGLAVTKKLLILR